MSGRAGTPFEARRVAPSRGFGWLGESLALLKAQTARLLLIALLLQLILGFTQLPIVGLLVILAVPALNAGVLQCFHVTAAGGRPERGEVVTSRQLLSEEPAELLEHERCDDEGDEPWQQEQRQWDDQLHADRSRVLQRGCPPGVVNHGDVRV